jgi:glycosyltransferase involved in cell wall biosynthesis
MRIAHLTAPAQFGGLERVVAGLVRESAGRGHDVMLVLTLEPGSPVPAWAGALAGERIRIEPLHLHGRAYLAERRAVRALLRDHRSQVVHTHGFRSDVVHEGVARGQGTPLVSTAHGFASVDSRGRFYEWLQVRAWKRFDAVVAVALLTALERAGVPRSRLRMIRNGFVAGGAPVPRDAARERLGLAPDGPVLGWVGRFSEEKDPLLAVEAFARLGRRDARLCMVGDGPLRDECRAVAASRGVEARVILPGSVADAGPLIGAFNVLVLSSRTEGTPMVVLEAAAALVPVVSTAVGGVPDLLGDDRGWLAPPGDASALSAAMETALSRGDEAARRAHALKALVTAPAGDEDWVDHYLALYREVAGN